VPNGVHVPPEAIRVPQSFFLSTNSTERCPNSPLIKKVGDIAMRSLPRVSPDWCNCHFLFLIIF